MKTILLCRFLSSLALALLLLPISHAQAQAEMPDAMVEHMLTDVLSAIRNDKAMRAGDTAKVVTLVDSRIMPNVNFQRMTAAAVGPAWRQASAEQQQRLQDEFKVLLVRAYAGALAKLEQRTVSIKPLKLGTDDKEVLVRAEIKGGGETIELDYRLEKLQGQTTGWRIFNLKVMGAWLVETYRGQFAQEISTKGIDGLISSLSERNKSVGKKTT